MWPDNDIDKAFRRLNPPETGPTPFPLDAWLRLETELDKAVIARAVRHKLWRFFAAEVAVVALVALGWLLWPTASAPAMSPATGPAMSPAVAAAPKTAVEARSAAPESASSSLVVRAQASSVAHPAATAAAPLPTSASAPAAAAVAIAAARTATAPATAATGKRPANAAGRTHALVATAAPVREGKRSDAKMQSADAKSALAYSGVATATVATDRSALSNQYRAKATKTDLAARHLASAAGAVLGTGRAAVDNRSKQSTASAGTTGLAAVRSSRHRASLSTWYRHRKTAAQTAFAKNDKTSVHNGKDTGGESAGRAATSSEQASAPAMDTPGVVVGPDKNAGASTGTEALSALALRPVPLVRNADSTLPAPLATIAAAEAPAPPTPARQPHFYIGLAVAPDVSTVKFAGVASPLLNAGVTIEYRLTNRLRLSTGLLRSTKQYAARREDYDWGTYASRVYQRNFTTVDGTCTVLDVPLNLRYDWLVRPQYRLFGSAGLSSFFMQRERYTYAYVENNTAYLWQREAVNENRHLLGVVNVSIGYERTLGAHWSLQAEPYVKIPLAGVGAGKVRLTSGGVFVGVKYGF